MAPIRNDTTINLNSLNYNLTNNEITYKEVHYGQLYNTRNIDIPKDIDTPMIYDDKTSTNGISFSNEKITFTQIGVYKIGTSIIYNSSSGSGTDIYFWFNYNNTPIPYSLTVTYVDGLEHKVVVYVEIIVDLLD
jgi:hypothetical protein